MLKYIGYIGYGFVGKACESLFKDNSKSLIVDPKYSKLTISEMIHKKPSVVFVSINAPTLSDSTVDMTIIKDVFNELQELEYNGIVILKSTVPPIDCEQLSIDYPKLRYVYCPEFLIERDWEWSCKFPPFIIIGVDDDHKKLAYEVSELFQRHSQISDNTPCNICSYREAALIKYTVNSFLALKVVFFNEVNQLFSDLQIDGDWGSFADTLSMDERMGNSHMRVPGFDDLRGFGGHCFPKDTRAMLGFDKENRLSVLNAAVLKNLAYRLKQ